MGEVVGGDHGLTKEEGLIFTFFVVVAVMVIWALAASKLDDHERRLRSLEITTKGVR